MYCHTTYACTSVKSKYPDCNRGLLTISEWNTQFSSHSLQPKVKIYLREKAIFPVDRGGDILAVNRSKCGSYISKLGMSEGTNQLSAG